MNILLTGGAGYIGSHTAVALAEAGHQVVIVDNFSNSQPNVLKRLAEILGRKIPFVESDIRDTALLEMVIADYKIDSVMHFAGLKSVAESVENPIDYYDQNVSGTISLLKAMRANNVKKLVFSSSATVYGHPNYLPIDETHPLEAMNPYGRSKLNVEQVLTDLVISDNDWSISSLRYFNPVGAHSSGLIGENPNGVPNNLMPFITAVATGKLQYLNVYGDDYPTIDGTGVRDYIHVVDLAQGHLAAINFIKANRGFHVFNLGAGVGVSVLEMVREFERVAGKSIPLRFVSRRPGDVAVCYAKVEKAQYHLNWKARKSLHDICSSAWNFQKSL